MADVTRGPLKDHSGTIAAPSTAQQLMPASPGRSYLLIQNLDTSNPIYVDFDGTDAVEGQPSVTIGPGISWEREGTHVPNGEISIIAPLAAMEFTAKEG